MMTIQPLQLANTNLVETNANPVREDTAILLLKRLTRQSTAVTKALAETPLRFTLVKCAGRRLHIV